MYEEEEFQLTYDKFIGLANDLLEDVDVMMIAAVMTTIGMSLYKSTLTEEEYHKIVDAMYALKDEIKTLGDREVLH